MKKNWRISLLVFVLALVSLCIKQWSAPNQEIVLQFTNIEVSAEQTQNTISHVRKQLEDIGVENIIIQDFGKGVLKIRYYSAVAVSEVKKLVYHDQGIEVEYLTNKPSDEENSPIPLENDYGGYQLSVHEIDDTSDLSDVNGIVVEPRLETIRFFISDSPAVLNNPSYKEKDNTHKLAYTLYQSIAIAIDDSFYTIPEGRAGPKG